jgi:integrase/recombinase XerD
VLKSWHIEEKGHYYSFLNESFPDQVLFYVYPNRNGIVKCHESFLHRKIIIHTDRLKNFSLLKNIHDHRLIQFLLGRNDIFFRTSANTWILKNTEFNLSGLMKFLIFLNYSISFKDIQVSQEIIQGMSEIYDPKIETFRKEMESLGYTDRTISQYTRNIHGFLNYIGNDPWIEASSILNYIYGISVTRRYSRSFQNQIINSVKLYFRLSYGRVINKTELKRPKRHIRLPVVIAANEFERLLSVVTNPKHRTMIYMIYATGMKSSELLRLKPGDINFSHKTIQIRKSNSGSYRIISVTDSNIELLRSYFSLFQPVNYLFEGLHGKQYSLRVLQKAFRRAVLNAGVKHHASLYTLRHSYALKLIATGTEISEVQKILGHECPGTTRMYQRMSGRSGKQKDQFPTLPEYFLNKKYAGSPARRVRSAIPDSKGLSRNARISMRKPAER